jgi:hypothetical protein
LPSEVVPAKAACPFSGKSPQPTLGLWPAVREKAQTASVLFSAASWALSEASGGQAGVFVEACRRLWQEVPEGWPATTLRKALRAGMLSGILHAGRKAPAWPVLQDNTTPVLRDDHGDFGVALGSLLGMLLDIPGRPAVASGALLHVEGLHGRAHEWALGGLSRAKRRPNLPDRTGGFGLCCQ